MQLRAALTLLVCFGWHLAAPLAVLAEPLIRHAVEAIATNKDAPAACWTPRAGDARDLVAAPERQHARLAVGRVCRTHRARAAALVRRPDLTHRSIYPARRLARLRVYAGDDGAPA